ncbi:MAG: META domain-containing protein [Aeromonas sp.]
MTHKLLIGAIGALLLGGCTMAPSTPSSAPVDHLPLKGTQWQVPNAPEEAFTLRIEGNRVGGQAACNRFAGQLLSDGKPVLTFSPLRVTRMLCPPNEMQAEQAFLAKLAQVASFSFSAQGQLELRDVQGQALLQFTGRAAAPTPMR